MDWHYPASDQAVCGAFGEAGHLLAGRCWSLLLGEESAQVIGSRLTG